MRIRILGPLDYQVADLWCRPAGARQQKLLAGLLTTSDQVVSVGQLTEAVWDSRPPLTAERQIVNGVSTLRQELGRYGGPSISYGPGGYTLQMAGHHLDATEFRGLVDDARSTTDVAAARDLLRDALGLWRGPAMAGLRTHPLRAAAERLDDSRLRAYEQLSVLELRCDNAGDALDVLAEISYDHPFQEQLVAARMVALVGTGRRTEALAAFLALRAGLVAELGIEPQAGLVELHGDVLRGTGYPELVAALAGGKYSPRCRFDARADVGAR
jgi:DNA-binding SARP family transcriptional activator